MRAFGPKTRKSVFASGQGGERPSVYGQAPGGRRGGHVDVPATDGAEPSPRPRTRPGAGASNTPK